MSETIHELVRSRYGEMARESHSCCAPTFYDEALLTELPAEVTELSLGCGNPLESADLQPGRDGAGPGQRRGHRLFPGRARRGAAGARHRRRHDAGHAGARRSRAGAHGPGQVEFREGQIEALPVDSDSIDVILSNCVINLAPDKAMVFREAWRALKPGGRIAISDIVSAGEFAPELRADQEKWAECVTGAIPLADYTCADA